MHRGNGVVLALLALTSCGAPVASSDQPGGPANAAAANETAVETAAKIASVVTPEAANATAITDTVSDDVAAVRATVKKLYAGYNTGKGSDYTLSKPFDAAWMRAIGKDGALDYDPFCQCQDFDKVRVIDQRITITGDTARDSVTFVNFGTKTKTVLGLVRDGDQWKIDDIFQDKGESMKAAMLESKPGSWSIDAQ